jgi:hypothetical protein
LNIQNSVTLVTPTTGIQAPWKEERMTAFLSEQ